MKKLLPHHTVIALVLYSLFLITLEADAEWRLLGLENDTILSIAKDKFTDDGVIVGTKSSGIKIYNNGWFDISSVSLPVNDIFVTCSLTFIAAIGAGSNSDGLYSACAVDGPPFYILGSMPFYGMMFPQAVSGKEEGDSIYMANGNSLVSALSNSPSSGTYTSFSEIKIPPDAFGVENPKCAALHVLSEYSQLYAGGYDESPEPGQGHLLWMLGDKDSMFINSQLNVTSITEGYKEIGGLHLYASTKDSGIYYRIDIMSMPIAKFAQSPNNEPVNDMFSMYSLSLMTDFLFLAVKSGVYFSTDTSWTKLGNIPNEPICLAGPSTVTEMKDLILYAGTAKGVYVFDTVNVSIKNPPHNNHITMISIQHKKDGVILISFQLNKPENLTMDIFNSSGKKVTQIINGYFSSGTHRIAVNATDMNNKIVSNGVYFLRLSTEKEQVNKRFLFVR